MITPCDLRERAIRIDRRAFLTVLGALHVIPLACYAQPAGRVRRIGYLSPDTADSGAGKLAAKLLPDALRKLGYVEGKNLLIE